MLTSLKEKLLIIRKQSHMTKLKIVFRLSVSKLNEDMGTC